MEYLSKGQSWLIGHVQSFSDVLLRFLQVQHAPAPVQSGVELIYENSEAFVLYMEASLATLGVVAILTNLVVTTGASKDENATELDEDIPSSQKTLRRSRRIHGVVLNEQ